MVLYTGFPSSIESIETVLNCEIDFKTMKKYLNFAK